MKWEYRWAEHIQSGYYYHLLGRGLLTEEDTEPDIGPFSFYMDAFRELSTCRVNAMSLGPIPFTAIAEYSKLFEVEDFEEFHYYIRVMDNTLLRMEHERMKAKEKQ